MPKFRLHSLINLRQVKDVLSSILDHISGQGSLLPKIIMLSHDHRNLLFLGVSHVDVVLK